MTKDLDQFLSEFDEDQDKKKKQDSVNIPESPSDSELDDAFLNPDTGTDTVISHLESPDTSFTGENESIPDVIPGEKLPESETEEEETGDESMITPPAESVEIPPAETVVTEKGDNVIPAIPGTRSWNTRQPYILSFSQSALDADMSSMETSFYIVQGAVPRDQLTDELKRSLLKYLKKQITSLESQYRELVNRAILVEAQKLLDYFSIDHEKLKLFMYHLGMSTVFNLLAWRFRNSGTGFCYRYGTDGKTIRFFPETFLRKVVVDWFQDNIHTLSLPFDSLQVLDSFKSTVSRRYMEEEREFRSRLEKINQKIEPSRRITVEKLMKMKGGEWYDQACVMTYRRYMGRTIFG